MRTELCMKFKFIASHSLTVREEPHPHLWRVDVSISGEPQNGMIVNLQQIRSAFNAILLPLHNTFLNENAALPAVAQAAPTCETLSDYLFSAFDACLQAEFLPHNPTLQLASVEVAICEPDGFEWGSVRRTRSLIAPQA
ncbi:MAG: 6-carboxytetrahydropterin synthase [Chloroherpetonaceae bacterium]|nr:6-carboxytetrahydropterin synthase [Chloroherpetonaceae bacterium]